MESTPDIRISRSSVIEDELRKTGGLLCIEWNIENYKSLLQEKRCELLTSPTFRMRGAIWKLCLKQGVTCGVSAYLYLVDWESERKRPSITYLMTMNFRDNGEGIPSLLHTFLLDGSESLDSETGLQPEYLRQNMTSDSLRLSCVVFPEEEDRATLESSGAKGVETHTNTSSLEVSSETFDDISATISPSPEIGNVQDILPTDDNFRVTGGFLFVEWNIKNYKTLLREKRLDSIVSPTFRLRDASWNLVLEHTPKYVTSVLYRSECKFENKGHSINITCLMTMLVNDFYLGDLKTFLFKEGKGTAAVHSMDFEFFSKSLTSDDLKVFCIVFPEVPEATSKCGTKEVETCSNTSLEGIDILASDMKNLFLNGENSDFVIRVKDREFHVHKAILAARSPVLSAMLQHDMTEKNSATTNIGDCESDVFERFLLYLYSGEVEELSWSNATHLYTLGDKYDVPHLRKECLRFMEGNLSIQAFCDAIALAVKHNEKTLVKCAEAFFLRNVKSILVTNKWQLFLIKNPIICNELFLKIYK